MLELSKFVKYDIVKIYFKMYTVKTVKGFIHVLKEECW